MNGYKQDAFPGNELNTEPEYCLCLRDVYLSLLPLHKELHRDLLNFNPTLFLGKHCPLFNVRSAQSSDKLRLARALWSFQPLGTSFPQTPGHPHNSQQPPNLWQLSAPLCQKKFVVRSVAAFISAPLLILERERGITHEKLVINCPRSYVHMDWGVGMR